MSEAIDSALQQKYEPKEVIVVDDGSDDESFRKIKYLSDNIKIIRNEVNRGEAYTTNRAIENASGELVKILHADDRLCMDVIEKQVEKIQKVDTNTIVFGDSKFVTDENGFHHRDKYRPKRKNESHAHYLLKNNPHPSCLLHRRSLLLKHERFDTSVPMPDYDFHLRLGLAGVQFRYVPGDVSIIRIHDGPDRVQNQDHFSEEPEGRLNRIQDRWQRIEEAGMLTEEVQKYLARAAWRGGRQALRKGYKGLAEDYFGYARGAHPDPVAGSSPAYKWCVQALGPGPAEKIAAWKRTLVGK